LFANEYSTRKSHNRYKSTYLRAVLDNDQESVIKSLRGVVSSGEKLNINVEFYKNELHRALKEYANSKRKKELVRKVGHPPKVVKPTLNRLKRVRSKKSGLTLEFNHKLTSKKIRQFKLYDKKNKYYRYVIDIEAILPKKIPVVKLRNVAQIRIAQFNKKKMRMVFNHPYKLSVKYSINKKNLIIDVKNLSKSGKIPPLKIIQKDTFNYSSKTIVIDPGHGGKDVGAIGFKKIYEKDIVLAVSKRLEEKLRKRGFRVYMTRRSDKFIKLRRRTEYANVKKADLFVSIHSNAASRKNSNYRDLKGVETYFLSASRSKRASRVAQKENRKDMADMDYFGKQNFLHFLNREKIIASNKLAIDVQQGILGRLNKHYKDIRDSGVREGPFWVLVGAQMPSVLIELGYVTNKREVKNLTSRSYQKRLAQGISEGITRYFKKNIH